MNFITALFLDAQHVNLLRDIHVAVDFDDVEIAAAENSPVDNLEPWSFRYASISKKLVFNGVFRGGKHMHAVFTMPGDEDNFYCVSYARHGDTDERIIFRLICHI